MRRLIFIILAFAAVIGLTALLHGARPLRDGFAFSRLVRFIYFSWLDYSAKSADPPTTPFTAGLRMNPELPRRYLDTAYIPFPCTIIVPADGNVQAAINRAKPGDTICLAAGARFNGHFVLRAKPESDRWITIRTARTDVEFRPPHVRVSPQDAPLMSALVTPDTEPALATESNAHHYRLIGLEFTGSLLDHNQTLYSIVQLGLQERTESELPHDIIIDRCYLHGLPEANVRRDLSMNATRVAVVDSYLSEAHDLNSDSQAIECWNGPGPFKIVNNYLEGAGENVMFGGARPSIRGLVPSDIELRHNYFFKPLRWKQRIGDNRWVVKNLLELKNARRVQLDGNLFENCWPSGQDGTAILLNGVDGALSVIEDVTIANNVVSETAEGITGTANAAGPQLRPTNTIVIRNNLFNKIRPGNSLNLFALANVTIEHNTFLQEDGSFLALGIYSPSNFADHYIIRDNIASFGPYGIVGLHLNPSPAKAFVITNNIFIRAPVDWLVYYKPYPHNSFPRMFEDVGFIDLRRNVRLARKSPYKNTASDGKDPGADIDAIENAVANADGASRTQSSSLF
jgi:hypothetical protein